MFFGQEIIMQHSHAEQVYISELHSTEWGTCGSCGSTSGNVDDPHRPGYLSLLNHEIGGVKYTWKQLCASRTSKINLRRPVDKSNRSTHAQLALSQQIKRQGFSCVAAAIRKFYYKILQMWPGWLGEWFLCWCGRWPIEGVTSLPADLWSLGGPNFPAFPGIQCILSLTSIISYLSHLSDELR